MRIDRWAVALLVIVLVGTLLRFHEREQYLVRQLDIQSPSSLRSQIQDAIIGNRFPVDSFPGWRPSSDGVLGGLVWVVRVADCLGCLSDVADWNSIASADVVPSLLVLVGAEDEDLVVVRRLISPATSVMAMPAQKGDALFGWMLGSTQVLLDPEGVIVAADSRASGQACGWSFAAQAGVFLGLRGAREIRD